MVTKAKKEKYTQLRQKVTDLFKLGEEKGGWRRFRESCPKEAETGKRF